MDPSVSCSDLSIRYDHSTPDLLSSPIGAMGNWDESGCLVETDLSDLLNPNPLHEPDPLGTAASMDSPSLKALSLPRSLSDQQISYDLHGSPIGRLPPLTLSKQFSGSEFSTQLAAEAADEHLKTQSQVTPDERTSIVATTEAVNAIAVPLVSLQASCVPDPVVPQPAQIKAEKAMSKTLKAKKQKVAKIVSSRMPWSLGDERILLGIIEQYGAKKWSMLATLFSEKASEPRTGKQLRERYKYHLQPGINKEPWTKEEDVKIIKLVKKAGTCWASIAKKFPGRTDNMIKNRWYSNLSKGKGA